MWKRDCIDFMPVRSKSVGDEPSGAEVQPIINDPFGIKDMKKQRRVTKKINKAYVVHYPEPGLYKLNKFDRHNFPFDRNAKTEVDSSVGSLDQSLQDVSALEKSNINDLWYKYIFNDNSPIFGIGLDENANNESKNISEQITDNSMLSNISDFEKNSNMSKFQTTGD